MKSIFIHEKYERKNVNMSDMLKELLKEGASAAQVELTDEQLNKFE